jgi:hypothetical protein
MAFPLVVLSVAGAHPAVAEGAQVQPLSAAAERLLKTLPEARPPDGEPVVRAGHGQHLCWELNDLARRLYN